MENPSSVSFADTFSRKGRRIIAGDFKQLIELAFWRCVPMLATTPDASGSAVVIRDRDALDVGPGKIVPLEEQPVPFTLRQGIGEAVAKVQAGTRTIPEPDDCKMIDDFKDRSSET